MRVLGMIVTGAVLVLPAATKAPLHTDKRQAAALELVKAELKDPDSAKFKSVKPLSKPGNYCGFVNSKNSFGGYTGFSAFYVYGEKVIIIPPEQTTPGFCS